MYLGFRSNVLQPNQITDYLVRVVQPNLPEKSLAPRRGFILLTLFVSLLVAYGIGWLILAGILEHAA